MLSGCASTPVVPNAPPPPTVLGATPTLLDAVSAINRTASIRQLATNTAEVDVTSMRGVPALSAVINLQRDRQFRLQAKLPMILGSGLDMGSNDQVFWFEVPENLSQVLFWARHDAYQRQLQRTILPVDPTWVMDALGLVQIDPATVIAGPVRRADGKLEIRCQIAGPTSSHQRVYLIDSSAGYVTDQFVYSPGGQLVAYSSASNPRYYETENCVLPHTVELALTPANGPPLTMRIDVGTYTRNQLLSNDPNLFTMPTTAAKSIDLAAAATAMAGTNPAPTGTPTALGTPNALGTPTTVGNPTAAAGTPAAPVAYQRPHYQSEGPLGPLPYRGIVSE